MVVTQAATSVTSLIVQGVLTNADNWYDQYGVAAVYPGGGLSTLVYSTINVGSQNGPAAPQAFYGYPDTTGTNVILTWSPTSGAVVGYVIFGGIYDGYGWTYDQLGEVGSNSTSFVVSGAIDEYGYNLYTAYSVMAAYANGSLSQASSWTADSGAPAPEALYAYLEPAGTNVELTWTPAQGPVMGYLVQRSDYWGSWTYEIGTVGASTNWFVDLDAVDSDYFDVSGTSYEVQAMYTNGVLSAAVTAAITNTPPMPSNFAASLDGTGTNVTLTWTQALGIVSNYIIERGTLNPSTGEYSYSPIATVSAGTTSYADTGVSANNHNQISYLIKTVLADGGVSQLLSSPIWTTPLAHVNLDVTASLVRNSTGHWQLMFSEVPAQAQTILVEWCGYDYYHDLGPFNFWGATFAADIFQQAAVPASSLTNGIYVIPDSQATNWIGNNESGWAIYVQAVNTNNLAGNPALAGYFPYDAPCFIDGRQHLKQNVLFQLRSATLSKPVAPLQEYNVWDDPFFDNKSVPVDTNYVESSIFHSAIIAKGSSGHWVGYVKKDDLWPITVNYELNQLLFDADYSGPSSFIWQTNLVTIPAPAVLGIGDPYWTYQFGASYYFDPGSGLHHPIPEDALVDVGGYTNEANVFLNSGIHNLFGLAYTNALINQGTGNDPFTGLPISAPTVTLSPGGSSALTNLYFFYSQTVDPTLVSTGYYFAPINSPGTALPGRSTPNQPYPIPAIPGFANTNKTGLMITSVGNPISIGGWNKFAISNGSSSKFAYLGQYFETNAFLLDGSGNITTNATGVVSPYGDLFPTAPGMVAMVTMPDIDPPYEQGTGIVRVVSLNADANHDGVMDFTYNGPDFVSASKPFRFWANDDVDSGDDSGDGIPGQGSQGDGMRPSLYVDYKAYYKVHGTRDLVDFFPVYVNIGSLFQSNALSAGINYADTNWQFVLSQTDGVLRYVATDLTPTNYLNFLRDTNEAENLGGASLTTITNVANGGVRLPPSFIASIATNNEGIILVEAAAPTTQPLVLTIYHGTNQVAQTALPLSISGVEQMFRHKNILLNSDPSTVAERLTDAEVPNEPDTGNTNFIFLHGYNVNPQQARGWDADLYKRMYWSGSHAKFYGVTWQGYDSQIPGANVTINLQTNIVHAFNTAPLLNSFLNSLSGTNVLAAHSLGNMVVLSTLNDCSNQTISTYFMIDAAVAMEAIQGSATADTHLIYPDWLAYTNWLYASDWWKLFPSSDARSTLTWNNRLANLQNANVYNFYSSGEEVLREYTNGVPPSQLVASAAQVKYYLENELFNAGLPVGDYTWAWQEMLKGRGTVDGLLSSTHGGWQFSYSPRFQVTNSFGTLVFMSASQALTLTTNVIQTNSFFNLNSYNTVLPDAALLGTNGNAYAQANRNRILSDAIPCLTLPVGANPVALLGATHNFDMSTNTFENGWPTFRTQNTTEHNNWHHSDCRQVAYTFTYQLFDKMVTLGGLQ